MQVLWNPSRDCTGNLSWGLQPQNRSTQRAQPAPELLPCPCCKSRMCQQVCGPHGELRITPLSLLKITPPLFLGGERAGGPCACGPTNGCAAAAGGGAAPGAGIAGGNVFATSPSTKRWCCDRAGLTLSAGFLFKSWHPGLAEGWALLEWEPSLKTRSCIFCSNCIWLFSFCFTLRCVKWEFQLSTQGRQLQLTTPKCKVALYLIQIGFHSPPQASRAHTRGV